MKTNTSWIDSVELASGTEIYIQSSGTGKTVSLSVDGKESSFNVTISRDEAIKLARALDVMLEDIIRTERGDHAN